MRKNGMISGEMEGRTKKVTIIKIRRGINGYRYSACDENGFFIRNMKKLSDARNYWEKEIRWGYVRLIRELDQQPDMSRNEATLMALHSLLSAYCRGS